MNLLVDLGSAIRRGFSKVTLVATLVGIYLGCALLLSLPLALPLQERFGHSLTGRDHVFLSGDVAGELVKLLTTSGSFWVGSVIAAFALSFALQFAVAGGVVVELLSPYEFSFSRFSHGCFRYMNRSLRLSLWALLGALPLIALASVTSTAIQKMSREALYEDPITKWVLVRGVVLTAGYVVWRASFDAAKVLLVSKNMTRTRGAAWTGFLIMVNHPVALIGYALVGFTGLSSVYILARMHALLPVDDVSTTLVALLFAQIVLAVRLAFSLTSTAFAAKVVSMNHKPPIHTATAASTTDPPRPPIGGSAASAE
jgi:hypothetical protein